MWSQSDDSNEDVKEYTCLVRERKAMARCFPEQKMKALHSPTPYGCLFGHFQKDNGVKKSPFEDLKLSPPLCSVTVNNTNLNNNVPPLKSHHSDSIITKIKIVVNQL
eukprot:UN32032